MEARNASRRKHGRKSELNVHFGMVHRHKYGNCFATHRFRFRISGGRDLPCRRGGQGGTPTPGPPPLAGRPLSQGTPSTTTLTHTGTTRHSHPPHVCIWGAWREPGYPENTHGDAGTGGCASSTHTVTPAGNQLSFLINVITEPHYSSTCCVMMSQKHGYVKTNGGVTDGRGQWPVEVVGDFGGDR